MPNFANKVFKTRCARCANLRLVGHLSITKIPSVYLLPLQSQKLIKDHLTRRAWHVYRENYVIFKVSELYDPVEGKV
ncbi:unnamed protein product [Acanthoscelides obtectus]|uniref:Uncharacterized protein n=1 Tax=Acanthoscelides obtectus TaxID=200917 RepID=A0A9P0KDD9_ACAOB|nr:unnamed protein product [Acanthoscelides obtectus]CAK1635032.1 hypothetical protein AOBTE_LOCUS9014 [Acanthoscelides obtectus]